MQMARIISWGKWFGRGLVVGAFFGLALAGLRADSRPDHWSVITALGGSTGTPLSVAISSKTNQVIELTWSDLGAGFFYTLQERGALGVGQWTASASTNPWPVRTTLWTPPQIPGVGGRFYRVLARTNAPVARGTVLSATLVHSFTPEDITALFANYGLAFPSQYGVNVYKLVYATVDAWGIGTQASGALVVPTGLTNALPLVSYQHGTSMQKTDVPSASNTEANVGIAFATTGYLAALPDYVGLGDSPGFHPYHHAKSEATAVVDMLRASRSS